MTVGSMRCTLYCCVSSNGTQACPSTPAGNTARRSELRIELTPAWDPARPLASWLLLCVDEHMGNSCAVPSNDRLRRWFPPQKTAVCARLPVWTILQQRQARGGYLGPGQRIHLLCSEKDWRARRADGEVPHALARVIGCHCLPLLRVLWQTALQREQQ
jgi:hypothetical protein